MVATQKNEAALLEQLSAMFSDLDEFERMADDKFVGSVVDKIKDGIIAHCNAARTGDGEDEDEMVRALFGHLRNYLDRDPERRGKFAALLLSSAFWQRAKALKRGSGGDGGNGDNRDDNRDDGGSGGSSSHKPLGKIFESRNARDGR